MRRLLLPLALAGLAGLTACADPAAPSTKPTGTAAGLSLTLAGGRDSIFMSDTTRVTVSLNRVPPNAYIANVSISPSDTTVVAARVDSFANVWFTLLITGRASGQAAVKVTVLLSDSSTATATTRPVTVRGAYALAVWPDTNALIPGVVRSLEARDLASPTAPTPAPGVQWSSDAPNVATVDSSGQVTARAPGRATITAVSGASGSLVRRATAAVFVRSYPAPLAFTSVVTDAPTNTSPAYPHSCGLTRDGAAYCWGENKFGSLGTNDVMDRCETPTLAGVGNTNFRTRFRCSATPVAVSGGLRFTQLSTQKSQVCGVTVDGAVYCWGAASPSDGTPGAADPSVQGIPRRVDATTSFRQVAVGDAFACALDAVGAAWCWGRNRGGAFGLYDRLDLLTAYNGLLGTGSTDSAVARPQAVLGGLQFATITAGPSHVCGVTPAGAAWCWGQNSMGELGNGRPMTDGCAGSADTTCFAFALRPTPVAGGLAFREVRPGSYSTCGLTTGNALRCWGRVAGGALEQRPPYYQARINRVPQQVTGAPAFAALSGPPAPGDDDSRPPCGVGPDGVLNCFTNSSTVPTVAAAGLRLAQAATPAPPYRDAGGCGIGLDGLAYCWYPAIGGARGDGAIARADSTYTAAGRVALVAGQR